MNTLVFLTGCTFFLGHDRQDEPIYPQTLSVFAKKRFEEYQRLPFPLAFLVAKDGGYAVAWRCTKPPCHAPMDQVIEQAQDHCRQLSHLGDCLVHSIGREQVWPGETRFDTTIRSRLVEPFRLAQRGPEQVQSVVLYIPGYGGHRYPPSLTYNLVPPYLHRFHAIGYDVLRLNIAHYDYSIFNDKDIDQAIHQVVGTLHGQGYRQVILAGESRGAWHILRAAHEVLPIDAAIVAAPAAHGTPTNWEDQPNPHFGRNTHDFEQLIAAITKIRVLFLFFAGDAYDAGGKAQLVQQHLGVRLGQDLMVIYPHRSGRRAWQM